MKKFIVFLIVVLFLFVIVGCEKDTLTTTNTEPATETITEETTVEETVVIVPESEVIEETTENLDIIDENPFDFVFRYEDEEIKRSFKAKVDGKYRFDFGTDDATCDYRIQMLDEKNNEIFNTYYSSEGKTRTLTKGTTYKLIMTQVTGFPTGHITIGIPNEIKTVENDKISDKLTYIDQENVYIFHTDNEGVYRFDYLTNNVTCDYKVRLVNEINEDVFNTHYSNSTNGSTARLGADTDYKIFVSQSYGLLDYQINIHEPLEIQSVSGTFSDEMSFIGQENVYEYIPSESGKYEINLNFYDKECYCKMTLKDDINRELISTSSENIRTVTFEKGRKYKFVINYGNGFLKYDVTIEKVVQEKID